MIVRKLDTAGKPIVLHQQGENTPTAAPLTKWTSSVPHNLDAERQVLGALMIRPDLLIQVQEKIGITDFFSPAHKIIYNSLLEKSRSSGYNFDAFVIVQYLEDQGLLQKSGGSSYVIQLAQEVLAPSGIFHHLDTLKSLALRRNLIQLGNQISQDAQQPIKEEGGFLRKIEDHILSITNTMTAPQVLPASETKTEVTEHLQRLKEAGGKIIGLETGFREFDHITSGLKPGELIVVAARPGMGKTTFAMNLVANIALNTKKNVLVFSLEMSRLELIMRMICSEAQFSHSDLKRGHLGHRFNDIHHAIDQICSSPIYIDDSGDLTVWDCLARTRKLLVELKQQQQNLDLIVIDYLQLMNDPEARKLGRQHEVATISRSLKQLARTSSTPVIAISQMNRSVEQRRGDGSKPQLSDLRESGAIEQDADIVMFIHRELQRTNDEDLDSQEYQENLENQGTVEMIVAKHRNGPVGSYRLSFRPEMNRFDNRLE